MESRLTDPSPKVENTLILAGYIKEKIHAGQIEVLQDSVQQLEIYFNQIKQLNIIEKLTVLVSLISYFRKIKNYDKCAGYARQAVSLSRHANNVNILQFADIYFDYSDVEYDYGQYGHARILLAQLLQKLEVNNCNDNFVYGRLYLNLGKINLAEENYEAGVGQLESALDLLKETASSNDPIVIKTVDLLVAALIKMEKYEKGIELYTQMLNELHQEREKELEVKTLLNISEIYYHIDLLKAKKVVEQALELMQHQDNNHDVKLRALMMLAEIEEHTGNLQGAVSLYKRSLDHLEDLSNPMSAILYSKIGILLSKINEFKQGKMYLKQALNHASIIEPMKSKIYFVLGKIYTAEKRFNKANEYFQYLLDEIITNNKGNKSRKFGHILQMMAYNYLAENNNEKALASFYKSLKVFGEIQTLSDLDKGLICKLNIL